MVAKTFTLLDHSFKQVIFCDYARKRTTLFSKDGHVIEFVKEFKYLGVLLQETIDSFSM